MIWLKRAGWALAVLCGLCAIVLLDFMRHGGQFRTLKAHAPGVCTAVPLEASAEDIQINRARGIAYLSMLDRRAAMQGGSARALDDVNYDIQITNKSNLHMECSHCENLKFNRQTAQEKR